MTSKAFRTIVPLAAVLTTVLTCRTDKDVATGPPLAAAESSTATLSPTADTYLNIDDINYATGPVLSLYTWPADTVANAVVMKFDLASIPAATTIVSATLNLYLVESDASADPSYTVSVHGIVNHDPDVASATGYTYDGVNSWTPNSCCRNDAPMAQADISVPVDTRNLDKTVGFKQWDVTALVRGWLSDPSSNFGLLLNSDRTASRDRYRSFASSEDAVAGHRPYLTIVVDSGAGEPPPEATVGQWSGVIPAPIVQLHLSLLPNGRVLSWGLQGEPQIWDPETGNFTAVPAPSLLFCAGHDFLADGRLFVVGGHLDYDHGLPNTNVFDAATGSWQVAPPMAQGRWYPTTMVLEDGQMLAVGGRDEGGAVVTVPEVWNGTSWRRLTTASLELSYYPRLFNVPGGRVFYAGEERRSRYLDVTGTGRWIDGPLHAYAAWRDYGSGVMYEPGKILYVGGGDPPTNTAETIDLNQPSPAWSYTGSMVFARRQMNATLLPTGEVLVTGGTSAGGFNDSSGAVHAAEVWNPTTGMWTTLASNAITRIYHSTTLLLPDGRVLHTGSGDGAGAQRELNYEIFSPPYLFRGPRPMVTAAPSSVAYGQQAFVETVDGADIAKVAFIRLSSVTHALDQGARFVPLAFSPVPGGLSVVTPGTPIDAPPGPYMLFLVNRNGVPSVARIMLLQ